MNASELNASELGGWVLVQFVRQVAEINVLKMARLRAKLNNMGSEWRHFEHVDFFKPVH